METGTETETTWATIGGKTRSSWVKVTGMIWVGDRDKVQIKIEEEEETMILSTDKMNIINAKCIFINMIFLNFKFVAKNFFFLQK